MWRGLSRFLFFAVTLVVVFSLVPYAESFLPLKFAPVYLREFEWPSAYSFSAGLLGLLIFGLARLGLGRERPAARAVLYGMSAALVLFAFTRVERFEPGSVAWLQTREPDLVALDRNSRAVAARQNLPILYYFRADWCPTCPEFERHVLGRVAAEAAPFLAVQMDVTDFERWHAYIKKEYDVEATPTIVLRDRAGRVLKGTHFTGEHVSLRALRSALRAVSAAN